MIQLTTIEQAQTLDKVFFYVKEQRTLMWHRINILRTSGKDVVGLRYNRFFELVQELTAKGYLSETMKCYSIHSNYIHFKGFVHQFNEQQQDKHLQAESLKSSIIQGNIAKAGLWISIFALIISVIATIITILKK